MLQLIVRVFAHQPFGNPARAIQIDEEVVIDDPEHLERIPPAQVDCFFDKLLRRQCIPFPPVDAGISAVASS